MKVITRQKSKEEILSMLEDYARIVIVGCGTCPTVCRTGGLPETQDMEAALAAAGKLVTGRIVVNAACDASRALFISHAGQALEDAQAIVVMACGLGVQSMARFDLRPVVPALDSMFFGIETGPGAFEEICSQCGACILGFTGGICPVTSCHKGLLNGPCGGTNEGMCEVGNGRPCAWTLIYERLEKAGRLDMMRRYQPPAGRTGRLQPGMWKLTGSKEGSTS